MAEDNKPDAPKSGSRFHYYSGGEIKEQSDTKVSPLYWALVCVLIVCGVGYFLFGGALGPRNPLGGGFKPKDATSQNLNKIQQQLNTREGTNLRYASVNLNDLPVPQGQTISQAIVHGSEVYQTYCIGCHGPNEDGNGVNAASLNPKPRNLHDAPFMQAMSYQRITTSLHKGVPGTAMPRWENTLSENEIGDVIAYVFSLTSPAGPAAQGNAASGGSSQFVTGSQNSPKPITPAVGGNPTAPTNTAPPSQSGPTPEEVQSQLSAPNNAQTDNQAPGVPAIVAPKPGAPVPGSPTVRGATGGGGTGVPNTMGNGATSSNGM